MGNTPSAEVLMCVLKVKDCVKVKKKKKTFLLIVDFIIFSESVSEKKRKAAMEFCFFPETFPTLCLSTWKERNEVKTGSK